MAEENPEKGPIPSAKSGAKYEELQHQCAANERRIVELTDDLKRLQAEFDNFKKRNEKDLAERTKLANQRLICDLLPVLDSFDKALKDSEKNENSSQAEGVEKLREQLLRTLEKEGLREIRTDGKFDPFVHEALTREESEDADEGKILEVYQKGYMLAGKAIRPAKVKVAKRKEPEAPKEPAAAEAVHDDSCGTHKECLDDDME